MQSLYDDLKAKKKNGQKLAVEDLDVTMLRRLWWDESIPDSMIADLFDTTKDAITKRRYKFGLRQQDCLAYSIFQSLIENERAFHKYNIQQGD